MRLARSLSILSMCLVGMSGLAGYLSAAAAQQPEKRIALVVGNAAYAKSPLATAANDAGLIAQTLQAAGFDVIGARDLDGDTLRKSFRDFINKAEASGPDTVAMVYLAGYGLQLAGDNYFVPVDSAINRDTDVPIEALRVGDYVRQLGSLPLKAGIVVLDAARQQPFVAGQIASGLALVEADPRMLIAFNAAPGTVAPAEQGPYGIYAQSLAEMIRTGGLPLPEVFNRLRLRVNEASKGAQVPWDSQKVDAPFMFFERAPDAPAPAPPDQVAAIRDKPIRDLGVQEAYTAAVERDTMQGYEDFLGAYASDPLAKRVRAIVAARREAITWRRTYRTDTPNAYWSYLQRYPRGPHATDARRRLAILTAPLEPPPTFDVIDYDVPPPPPDEFVYIDRPVLAFGDPEFDFVPPPPPPVFFLPPPPDDFIVLLPPPPPIALFILPQPIFVPIPVYVRAPVYVAAPPNNIIFANIHNRAVINNVINRPPQPGLPGAVPGVRAGARANGASVAPGRDGCAGAGRRHADAAACGRAKGHADPAGQIAGAAERCDQSCGENRFAGRSVPVGPQRQTRRSRRMRRTRCLRTSPCRRPMRCRFQAPGVRHPRLRAPRYRRRARPIQMRGLRRARRHRHPRRRPRPARLSAPGPPSGRLLLRLRPERRDRAFPGPHRRSAGGRRTLPEDHGRCAAAQRRRAVEAGRCHRAETSVAARNSACAAPPPAVQVARPRRRLPALLHRHRRRGWRLHRRRVAAPPPPRMAAPSPPPPRVAAPPPRVAAPAAAAPDGSAPAAPAAPAPAAAARRCPPNVPKC